MIKRALACHSIEDLRQAARQVLPRMVFDFVDGGAQTESTVRANRVALDRYRLLARGAHDVSCRDTTVELFDKRLRMPLIIGPTGMASAFWPKGDVVLARAAASRGIPFVISHGATGSLAEIVEAAQGHAWLQIYLASERESSLHLLRLARDLGIEILEVTIDTPVPGRRVRDIANGFGIPFRWTAGKLLDVMRRPGWAWRSLRAGTPQFAMMTVSRSQRWETIADFVRSQINPSVTWDDLRWLREQWPGRLLIKGLIDPEQIPTAVATGFDGVVVSNHGGRQLDGAIGTVDVLAECVDATKGRLPVLVDGGFRSGTDVLKALALGASAVQLGRPTLYGLATAGEAGVERALSLFQLELDVAMALTGIQQPQQAHRKLLRRMAPELF